MSEMKAMSPSSDNDLQAEREVRKVEAEECEAVLRGDVPAMARGWSDDLIVNSPANRVLTKEQVEVAVGAGRLNYRTFERQVERVAVHGDLVVTMGHETVVPLSGPEAGTEIHRRYTNVWMKHNGEWKLIARQATVVKP